MNILMMFLISTSSNVSAPSRLQCEAPVGAGSSFTNFISPANLPDGPYQRSCSVSFQRDNAIYTMGIFMVIAITPNSASQWVAINRIIFCAAATEGL